MAQLTWPFEGLPPGIEVYFTLALAIIVVVFAWTMSLLVRSARWGTGARDTGDTDGFIWAFIVPALNEEVTIRDSVDRLRTLGLREQIILVVDDGSDDRTPEILTSIEESTLTVVRRDPPDARRGKAAALNAAYRRLGWIEGSDRGRVIVAIVDADLSLIHI